MKEMKDKINDNVLGISILLAILLAAFVFHVAEQTLNHFIAKWIWSR